MSHHRLRMRDLKRRIQAARVTAIPGAALLPRAAVSVIFGRKAEDACIRTLLIRRARHPGDTWSGDMAFPGGFVDPGDADPFDAARRETNEELGLDLRDQATHLGRLSQYLAPRRFKLLPVVVTPHVFELHHWTSISANEEVEEAVWIPLDFFLDRSNRGRTPKRIWKIPIPLPCYVYRGRVIWGLTLRMIDELVAIVGSPPH